MKFSLNSDDRRAAMNRTTEKKLSTKIIIIYKMVRKAHCFHHNWPKLGAYEQEENWPMTQRPLVSIRKKCKLNMYTTFLAANRVLGQ